MYLPLKGSSSRITLTARSALSGKIAFTASLAYSRTWNILSTKVTFLPPNNSSQVFRIHSAPCNPRRLAVKAHGEIGGIPASRRRRRAVDETAGRLAALLLQCRAGLRIPPLGSVDDRQLGFPGLRASTLMGRDTPELAALAMFDEAEIAMLLDYARAQGFPVPARSGSGETPELAEISLGSAPIGSSPRGRGTLHRYEDGAGNWRFIPAWAGNTQACLFFLAAHAVHPRVGGEHRISGREGIAASGSSPRGRGTPFS